MELTGIIKLIEPTQVLHSNFKKRKLVLTTIEEYPQHLLIHFTQDKCDLLNNLSVGQKVKININLRGREWINPNGKAEYFSFIQGWRISLLMDNPQQQKNTPSWLEEENENIPF